jgi:hypothetical protein
LDVRFGDLGSKQYVVILAGGTMPLDRIAELLELSEAEAVWGFGMAELGLDRMAAGLLERPGWTAYPDDH